MMVSTTKSNPLHWKFTKRSRLSCENVEIYSATQAWHIPTHHY